METVAAKKFTCKIQDRWMGSLESAYIQIITPKGTSLQIDKWPPSKLPNKWDTANGTLIQKLISKVYNYADSGTIDLTKEEVLLWKSYSDKQEIPEDKMVYKPKEKSYQARRFERNFKSQPKMDDVCDKCGWPLTIKDHGKWVGYFCGKCGAGGSRTKQQKRSK